MHPGEAGEGEGEATLGETLAVRRKAEKGDAGRDWVGDMVMRGGVDVYICL